MRAAAWIVLFASLLALASACTSEVRQARVDGHLLDP